MIFNKARSIFLLLLTLFIILVNQPAYAHGLIYETSRIDGNKIRITLKWSDPQEAKGIYIAYYHLKNGKELDIGYEIKEGADTSAHLDYSLSSAIPPIKITLTNINDVNAEPFDDIKGIEAEEYIKHLHDAGIINGKTGRLFSPKAAITRAEFTVIMVKALKLEENAGSENSYKDIGKHWARSTILTAVKSGLISGYQDGTIRPDNPITLAEAAAVISRAFTFNTAYNGIYAKLKQDKWYSGIVKKMFDVGILKTTDTIYAKFNEEAYISRANCAMMVSRALSTY